MQEVPAVSGGLKGTPDGLGLEIKVASALSPGGPIARALPGFEARPGQLAMADAVAGVFSNNGVLLAEAGTGTGKTLAYLVPAILSGERVLVSTGTKNLQEQIYFKDIPVLQQSLGVRFTATYMKGRANYLCLHRFEAFRDSPAFRTRDDTHHVALIEEWRTHTETGDRAEIEDLPEDLHFWGEIAASAENCIGADCPQFEACYVTRMRQRAAESDLVIVNHHLLCADAAVRQSSFGEVIPNCDRAIVDEAHQLEDVATQYFGISLSNYRVEDLGRDVERAISTRQIPAGDLADELRDDVDRLRDRAREFFNALQFLRFPPAPPDRARGFGGTSTPSLSSPGGGESRVRVRPAELNSVADEGLGLSGALDALEADLRRAKDVPEDVVALGRRAGEMRDELGFLLRADDKGYVYYLEARGRGTFLRAAPIDVSNIISELLFDRMKTTVLTSATLAVDGAFDYIKGRLGIRRAHELRLASEFDYGRQAILYLPPRMPDPRSREFSAAAAREVVEIVRRSRGRAFVLFTSYANLREVQSIASRELDYPIFVQGEAPRSALLRSFRATPNAVLLATSSFWQGVDVVGEALSCVVIDKIPFASPGDPITAARIEAISEEGRSAFGEYQIPLAILALQQGLGRLIRHRQDRGVLAILDPRLRTMGYGRRILASLPPAPVTHRLDDIEQFFSGV